MRYSLTVLIVRITWNQSLVEDILKVSWGWIFIDYLLAIDDMSTGPPFTTGMQPFRYASSLYNSSGTLFLCSSFAFHSGVSSWDSVDWVYFYIFSDFRHFELGFVDVRQSLYKDAIWFIIYLHVSIFFKYTQIDMLQ